MPSKREEAEEYYLSYVAGLMNEAERAQLRHKLAEDPAFAQAWNLLETEAEKLQLEDVLSSVDIEEKLIASKTQRKTTASRRVVRCIAMLASAAAVLFVILQFYNPFVVQPSKLEAVTSMAAQADGAVSEVTFQAAEGAEWILDGKRDIQEDNNAEPMALSTFMEQHDLAKSPQKYYAVRTPVVKDYKLQLEDGTVVWLNMSTTVRFPATFNGSKERRIFLDGEAYFEVAHRADQPFVVVTREGEVKVKGTVFNLSTDPKEGMQAALVSGRVEVKNQDNSTVLLQPGEEAVISTKGQLHTRAFNEHDKLSWMRGTHYFYKIPFAQLKDLLPKWYGMQVQFDADFPVDELISGVLHKHKLNSFLANIKRTTGHHYRVENNVILFSK